jgi:replication factor C subunit 3/5
MEPINRTIFENILSSQSFPNLLFYGPPGVGKTTSADNLIYAYQKKFHRPNKETIIHLNASDERGIEMIRNQINNFVKSNNMFEEGLKFVILDEVDYMTKNAQQALKNLLQSKYTNVRFCLICNYICKIEESLRNEFICVRFNHLPENEIYTYLQNIIDKEYIQVEPGMLCTLKQRFKSDIRSMVNYLQLHHKSGVEYFQKNNEELWAQLHHMFLGQDKKNICAFMKNIREKNIDIQQFLKQYFYFITTYDTKTIGHPFLNIAECLNHTQFYDEDTIITYFIEELLAFYKKLK